MNEEVITYLKTVANKDAHGDSEDFNAYDYSGGNFDDAYQLGVDDGEINMARELMARMGIEL